MPKIIDLSVAIENNQSEPNPPVINEIRHKAGAKIISKKMLYAGKKSLVDKIKAFFRKISGKWPLNAESFPDQEFLTNDFIQLTSHNGTHLDATWHYGSKSENKKACTVDEIPLEFCFSDGVVLDLSHKKPRSLIEKKDIEQALQKIGYEIKPLDIVLIQTNFDKKWGTPLYFTAHPGMSREATEFIVAKGVKIMGIDAYGFDRPFFTMVNEYIKTKESAQLWPAHFYGREKEYFHIERLANLDKIPRPYGFKIACFPIKIKNAGAAWIRAVAILENE